MRELTLDLVCELTREEIRERGLRMSSCVLRRDEVEAAKKDAAKDFGEQLQSIAGEMRSLSQAIRTGRERRPVTCSVLLHSPVRGTKRVFRQDTGEHVRDEPMSLLDVAEAESASLPDEAADQAEAEAAVQDEIALDAGEPIELPAAPDEVPNGFDA